MVERKDFFSNDLDKEEGFDGCNLSGYIMVSSPLTLPQLQIGIVHFLVASNVARYNAFSRAYWLGKTLRWLFRRRYEEFKLSIALVV